MNDSSILITAVLGLGASGVLLLVGIVLTAMARRHRGRAAVLGLIGCVVLLLGTLFNVLRNFATDLILELFGTRSLGTVFSIQNLISTFFEIVGTGLLIWGVAARSTGREAGQQPLPQGRQPQPAPHQPWPQPGPAPLPDWQQPAPHQPGAHQPGPQQMGPQQSGQQQPGWQTPGGQPPQGY
ncbi:hypothetical protein [Nonomuraea pusilla]|uniref:Uncharacterized protein n=1 Tax=Nonomuraea pusilla TaxID=46177 RepID=A0A1H7Z9U7_9ACTN|nr:hypothetical protein [Nonomuraea pusilla]SEM55180.1 hypothetical protein SAMN05660976_05463 [Nonomuraea pusilla]